MNTIDYRYQSLLQDILDNGEKKQTRNGEVLSVFGRQIRHKMSDGFSLLTTKKMYWKGIVAELLWFLKGQTNIKYLLENDCHIWDGDAFKNYYNKSHEFKGNWPDTKEEYIERIKTDDEFAKKWGELGPIYGRMWRAFDEDTSGGIDQIANLISDLKTNPDSRRLIVTAWHPGYNQWSILPPCHYGFQVYTRELSLEERLKLMTKNNDFINDITNKEWSIDVKEVCEEFLNEKNIPTRAISLMWNQRSVDTPLGLPFNIASYGLLLEIIAKIVNMVPDELIGNLGDCHIYTNQIDGVMEQLKRTPLELPKLSINNEFWNHEYQTMDGLINSMEIGDFQIENYQSHPKIVMPLSN